MGFESGISSNISQSVGNNTYNNNFNLERRLELLRQNSYDTTQGMYESVDAYRERIAKFRAQLLLKIKKENTAIAEKKYNDILSLYLSQTNDPAKMQQGLNQLNSLFTFADYNKLDKSFEEKLYLAQKQNYAISERMYRIKNGQRDTETVSNPMLYGGEAKPSLYNGDFQNEGERDFLS